LVKVKFMEKTFLRWNESYVETFRYTRLLTQLFSFCVSLTLILGFAGSIYNIYPIRSGISARLWQTVVNELAIQIFVALLFAIRFSLLFFKDKIYFWLSQFVWLFTYLLLLSQISSPEFGCTKNAFLMFGENFSYVFVSYIFFSPVRQLMTLIVSFSRISNR